jgi:hypothetical protein
LAITSGGEKIKPVSRSSGTLNKKIIDSTTYKSTGKNYNIGDLNDGAYKKCQSGLAPAKKKQMC